MSGRHPLFYVESLQDGEAQEAGLSAVTVSHQACPLSGLQVSSL